MSATVVFYLVFSMYRTDVVIPMQNAQACMTAADHLRATSRAAACIGTDGSVYFGKKE